MRRLASSRVRELYRCWTCMDGTALSKLFIKLSSLNSPTVLPILVLLPFVNDAIAAALLHGKGRDRIIVVSWREVDEPIAASFAFSSAHSLPFTPNVSWYPLYTNAESSSLGLYLVDLLVKFVH